jgi:membrane-bound serine protease (ClpP class)
MILEEKQEKILGFHASTDQLKNLIGNTGIAYTPLRPAGIALIEDQKVDVMTEGGFIEKDHAIQVILVEGNRVVVKEINI